MSDDRQRACGKLVVRIDRGLCIGSANCVRVGPEVFRMGEDGIVTFLDVETEAERDTVLEACRVCPVDALSVVDDTGARLVPE